MSNIAYYYVYKLALLCSGEELLLRYVILLDHGHTSKFWRNKLK